MRIYLQQGIAIVPGTLITLRIILFLLGIIISSNQAVAQNPPTNAMRIKECDKYLYDRGSAVNKYTGKRYSKYKWWINFATRDNRYGGNYYVRLSIQDLNEYGVSDGPIVDYDCVTDYQTGKVIGMELK